MTAVRTVIVYQILGTTYQLFLRVFHVIRSIVFWGRKRHVPPITEAILFKSATCLAAEIRERKIKCEEVIRSYIRRIQVVEPYINAVIDERFNEAIEEARNIDSYISSESSTAEQIKNETPLLGVPFTVKAVISVKGLLCTGGSLLYKDLKAHEDAEVVSKMKSAGAICLAITNTSEFGMGFEANNHAHGRTNNPYDVTRTSGGSTGGEGALIASGASVVGLGNDLAGSIRFPAFNNCIYGHKPSRGLVSNKGVFPVPNITIDKYLYHGPLCRYAEDLPTVMKIIANKTQQTEKFGNEVDFSKVKVYSMTHDGGNPFMVAVEEDLVDAQRKVTQYFHKKLGATVEDVNIRNMKYAWNIWTSMLKKASNKETPDIISCRKSTIKPIIEVLKLLLRQSKFTMNTVVALNIENLSFLLSQNYVNRAQKRAQDLQQELELLLDDNSVLLLPTFPKKALYHGETDVHLPSTSYMGVFNALGLPVTQCSLGLSKDGRPLGLQVIGKMGNDYLTIACAQQIEKEFGGWVPPGSKQGRILKP